MLNGAQKHQPRALNYQNHDLVDRVSLVHFAYHTRTLAIWHKPQGLFQQYPDVSHFLCFSLPTLRLKIQGQGKTFLRGNPSSLGQARHCLLKVPFIQVLPSSRSEITDGQAQKWMSCFLQTSCVCTGDKWHEIPLCAMAEARPPASLRWLWGAHSRIRGKQKTAALMKFSVFFCWCLFFKLFMPSC